MKATTLLSEYLRAEIIKESGPRLYTIKNLAIVELTDEKTNRVERKLAVIVDDDVKVLLNKQNTRNLIECFGTDETDEWIGRSFEAYFDPQVTFGGKRVGGLRVRGV